MKNSITVLSQRRGAGDIVVVLGILNLIKQNYKSVAIFKPLFIPNQLNSEIETLINIYSLEQETRDAKGIAINVAESILLDEGVEGLVDAVLERYNRLKEKYDFILCIGEDIEDLNSIVGRDLNIEIAKNLASLVIGVLDGKDLTSDEILDSANLWANSIKSQDAELFMLFANKCNQKSFEKLTQIDKAQFEFPIAFIPYSQELARLTLADIMEHLPVEWIAGEQEHIQHDIHSFKMGTMTLETLVKSFKLHEFIITSTDRVDLLLGVLTSALSVNTPISGGILLCGSAIDESVLELIYGLERVPIPILYTNWHEHELIPEAVKIKPSIRVENRRKIASALNLFFESVDRDEILAHLDKAHSDILTPAMFRLKLFERAKESIKSIILPEVEDDRVLLASDVLLRRKVVKIILVGSRDDILRRAKRLGVDLMDASILDPKERGIKRRYAKAYYKLRKDKGITLEMAYDMVRHSKNLFATIALYLGEADGMVSGAMHSTKDTITPALQIIKTKPEYRIASSCFFMCMPTKVLVYADCAINLNPTAKELATIAIETVESAVNFGIEPKVAMLSYSTGDSGDGSSVDKVKKATKILKEKMPDLVVAGPIQYDAAIDQEVSRLKMPDNPLDGQANIFIFPDLNTGNIAYKAVQRSSNATAVGPIMQGLKKPVNDLSRGCSVDDIIDTVAITAIQAQNLAVDEGLGG